MQAQVATQAQADTGSVSRWQGANRRHCGYAYTVQARVATHAQADTGSVSRWARSNSRSLW